MIWTEEADALLRELHADYTLSITQVAVKMAERLGVTLTKNACIGRSHRLGLYRAPPKPKKRPKLKRRPQPRRTTIVMTPDADDERASREARRAARTGLLVDFDSEQCRWPLEEISHATYHYCTNDKANLGSSYCIDHHQIAHPRRER